MISVIVDNKLHETGATGIYIIFNVELQYFVSIICWRRKVDGEYYNGDCCYLEIFPLWRIYYMNFSNMLGRNFSIPGPCHKNTYNCFKLN